MTNEVVIGHVCYKGNHIALDGESDYGCCGGHYYAEIRISVRELYPNPRGRTIPVRAVANQISNLVAAKEKLEWAAENGSTEV